MALMVGCAEMSAQKSLRHSPKLTSATVKKLAKARQSEESVISAFVRLKDETDMKRLSKQYGVIFNVNAGNLHTARIPSEMLERLCADPDVEGIDVGSEPVAMCDSARMLMNVDEVVSGENLPQKYNGEGVIVGVIDYGFDFSHPNFIDSDGKCRIVKAWDQNNNTGAVSDYGYGVVYDGATAVTQARHDVSSDTHGTHVLGIAAGSYDGTYHGVAQCADIAVVSTNRSEQGMIDGVDFLIKYADEVGKPLVINMSYGTVLGYKDGTSAFAIMLDNLLKDKAGRILCIAAGNEGHRNSMITATTNTSTILNTPSYGRENLFAQGEKDHKYSLVIILRNASSGETILEQTLNSDTQETKSVSDIGGQSYSSIYMSSQTNSESGAPSFTVNITYTKNETEEWIVKMQTDGGKFQIGCDYGSFSSEGKEKYVDGTSSGSIASTATGREPIAVGAYVSRKSYKDVTGTMRNNEWTRGDIYPKSGKGPTFDGRMKPDIAAPGAAVISSLNSYAASYSVTNDMKIGSLPYNERTYWWGVSSGTSMATPAVSGVVALWLQAEPTLTAAQVRDIMQTTAISDTYVSTASEESFGYGKIDALAGIKEILEKYSGIISTKNHAQTIKYDATTCTVTLPNAERINVYSLDGRKMATTVASSLDLSFLQNGMYVVKTESGCAKILVDK